MWIGVSACACDRIVQQVDGSHAVFRGLFAVSMTACHFARVTLGGNVQSMTFVRVYSYDICSQNHYNATLGN